MEKVDSLLTNQPSKGLSRAQIKASAHAAFPERDLLVLSRIGELPGLHAGDLRQVAKPRKSSPKKILHSLSTGVVLTVHNMKDPSADLASAFRLPPRFNRALLP